MGIIVVGVIIWIVLGIIGSQDEARKEWKEYDEAKQRGEIIDRPNTAGMNIFEDIVCSIILLIIVVIGFCSCQG